MNFQFQFSSSFSNAKGAAGFWINQILQAFISKDMFFFFCNPVGREDVDGFGFLLIPFGILSASESAGRLRISSFSR